MRRNGREILIQLSETIRHWNQKLESNEVSFRNESISSRRSTRSGLLIQRPTNRVLNVFSSSCEINGVILPVNGIFCVEIDIHSFANCCLLLFFFSSKKKKRKWTNRKRRIKVNHRYESFFQSDLNSIVIDPMETSIFNRDR